MCIGLFTIWAAVHQKLLKIPFHFKQ